jgi:hypothetical protein
MGTAAFPSRIEGFSLSRSDAAYGSEALIGNWRLVQKGLSVDLTVGNGALLVGDLRDAKKNDPHFVVRNDGEDCEMSLSWRVWRQQGGTVGQKVFSTRLTKGETVRVELPKPKRAEVLYVEYTLEKKGPGGFQHSRQRSYGAWIPTGRYTGRMFTDEFLFSNTVHLEDYPLEEVAVMLDYMQAAGYNCIRAGGGYWGNIEPEPGVWRVKRTDAITDMCLQRNLERIISLHSPCRRDQDPSIVQNLDDGRPKFPYPYLDRYEKFCERRVSGLRGKIRMFEDYNEVNLTGCPPERFADYERAAYRGLKKGNPDALLLSACWGGLASWTESYYKDENPDCFDVAAFHYHGTFESSIEVVNRICKIMGGVDRSKKWFANECATSSPTDDLYPAKTLFQKLVYSWSRGSIGYVWYNLRNKGYPERPPHNGELAYGQLTADLCPRGTLLAQNAINGTLRDAHFKNEVKARPDVFAWRFETEQSALFPMWSMSKDASERPILFRTNAERADVVDLFGNVTECPIRDGVLCVTVDTEGSILRLSPSTASIGYACTLIEPERKIVLNGGDFDIFGWLVNNPSEKDWYVKWNFELPQGTRALGNCGSLRVPAHGSARIESEISVDENFRPDADGSTTFGVNLEGDVSARMTSVLLPVKVATEKSPAHFKASTRDLYTSFVEGLPDGQSMYWGGGRDLSVNAYVCYPERQALHLRMAVNDDVHVAAGEGRDMYHGDSIQILLQLPGQAGSWEIGVRARSDKKTTDFCVWRAPGGLDGSELLKSASCRMSVDKKVPIPHLWYDVFLPFEALGTTRESLLDGQLRFNLIVNDNDGARREGYLSLIAGSPWKTENFPVVVFGGGASVAGFHSTVDAALEDAHTNLVERLLDEHGLLLDYRGEIPTPKDCAESRPNAMGWWSPIENGPMFTGPYLHAMCEKAMRSGKDEDRMLCRRMASGLMRAASVSDVPGMIVRGFGTDGKCHYPLGSEDQTIPWFYGLHAYVRSGLAESDEKARIVSKMLEVAHALEKNEWRCPGDGAFKGQNRGDIAATKLPFRNASHYLYLLRMLDEIDPYSGWLAKYIHAKDEKTPGTILPRWRVCEEGYVLDMPSFPVEDAGLWIYVCAQGCLAELVRMESDPFLKARYRRGLLRNAEHAALNIPSRLGYDNTVVEMPFKYGNWRTGYKWERQTTQKIAERVASSGDPNILGFRKGYERSQMTKPLSHAMILGLSGDEKYREIVSRVIRHYDYRTLNISEFFMAECAWYGLPRRQE